MNRFSRIFERAWPVYYKSIVNHLVYAIMLMAYVRLTWCLSVRFHSGWLHLEHRDWTSCICAGLVVAGLTFGIASFILYVVCDSVMAVWRKAEADEAAVEASGGSSQLLRPSGFKK